MGSENDQHRPKWSTPPLGSNSHENKGGSITWGQFGNIRESKIPKFSPPTAAFYPYKSRFLDLQISKFSPPTAAFYPYKSRFLYLQISKFSPPPAAFCPYKSRFWDLKISKFSPPTAAFYSYKSRFLNPKCITTKLTPSAWSPFDPKCMTSNLTPSAWPWVWPQVHDLEFDPKCMILVWPQVHSLWNWWFFFACGAKWLHETLQSLFWARSGILNFGSEHKQESVTKTRGGSIT